MSSKMSSSSAAAAAAAPHLCLRWNNYQSNLTSVFDQLLQNETFVDVTLAADGHAIKAHRMVLSACSPYFQALFFDNPCQHPIVILKDTRWSELKAIVEYMYRGEISVAQEELQSLLRVAETLRIRGLSELNRDAPDAADASPAPLRRPSPLVVASSAAPPASWLHHDEALTPSSSPRSNKRRRTSGDVTGVGVLGAASTPASPEGSQGDVSSMDAPLPLVSHAVTGTPPTLATTPQQVRDAQAAAAASATPQVTPAASHDDLDIKPGIAELIREEERARMLEGNHPWLSASPSVLSESLVQWRSKAPSWSKEQLQEAIQAIVTQRMRFTQASSHYGIPKGTLYDNILGKSKRMLVLDEVGLDANDEDAVLDFCCETSVMPYNRRTNKSLENIIAFVEEMARPRQLKLAGLMGFRWWWAFCKKHNIVSLFYAKNSSSSTPSTLNNNNNNNNSKMSNNNNVDDDLPENLSKSSFQDDVDVEEDEPQRHQLPFYLNNNNSSNNNNIHLSQAIQNALLMAGNNHHHIQQHHTLRNRTHSVDQDDDSDIEPENLSLHKH